MPDWVGRTVGIEVTTAGWVVIGDGSDVITDGSELIIDGRLVTMPFEFVKEARDVTRFETDAEVDAEGDVAG